MKKYKPLFFFSLFISILTISSLHGQVRYLLELFDEVEVQYDIPYATNITILTELNPEIGIPTLDTLHLDLYTPKGDTKSNRPLVLILHSGSFLPQEINHSIFGTRQDSALVEIAHRLAKRGYVVASLDYRLGMDYLTPNEIDRNSAFINAIYRGIQDSNTAIRFFKKHEDLYHINAQKITLWGVGTGGIIATSAGALDNYLETVIPKFIDPSVGVPMILESVNSNPFGSTETSLNIPNHTEVENSDEVQLVVNMGGFIADTSWMDAHNPPFINFHCPKDPFSIYKESPIFNGPFNLFPIFFQGSYLIAQTAEEKGLHSIWEDAIFDEAKTTGIPSEFLITATPFTRAANRLNNGLKGLFPIERPCLISDEGLELCEGRPWNWWDSNYWSMISHPNCLQDEPIEECNFHLNESQYNQDMSPEKGRTYIDSIMGYFAPRACIALDLPCAEFFKQPVKTEEVIDVKISIFPNPAQTQVLVSTEIDMPIQGIELYSITGRLIKEVQDIDHHQYQLQRDNLSSGMYLVKVQMEKGVIAQKILFQ